ncbi:glycoside hydrolase [Hymenopellis radicata]|nr:glycoside hydrolase [Hymenopellis radicata]
MRTVPLFTVLTAVTAVSAVWPRPQSFTTGDTPLKVDASNLDVIYEHFVPPDDLREAVESVKVFLMEDKLGRLIPGRGIEDASEIEDAALVTELLLSLSGPGNVTSIAEEATKELESRSDEYQLKVLLNGTATLSANSTLGLFRGLTPFTQLISRTFLYSLDALKRTLTTMSYAKMNMFHWHIVDSQSFPLVVPQFPELAVDAAYAPELIYNSSDVQEITDFAARLGIDILVKIDTPGHTGAIGASHPEHLACYRKQPWYTYTLEPPAGQLRFVNSTTVDFTERLVNINEACYHDDTETHDAVTNHGALDFETAFPGALSTFLQTMRGAIRAAGKTPVVWDDSVSGNLTLGPTDDKSIVMVWHMNATDSGFVASIADKGLRIIRADADYLYLDCGGGDWMINGEATSWCDPFKTWQRTYSFDPKAGLSEEQAELIVGGQQLLWSQQSSPANLDTIAASVGGGVLDWRWIGKRGISPIPLQPMWCALRPGECDLPRLLLFAVNTQDSRGTSGCYGEPSHTQQQYRIA